jgi:hypothetical protein
METRQSEAAELQKPWQLVGGKETEITRFKGLSTSCSFAADARAYIRILVCSEMRFTESHGHCPQAESLDVVDNFNGNFTGNFTYHSPLLLFLQLYC